MYYYYYATAGGARIWVSALLRELFQLQTDCFASRVVEEVLDHHADRPVRSRSLCGLLWQYVFPQRAIDFAPLNSRSLFSE